jgi:hypothetical protein
VYDTYYLQLIILLSLVFVFLRRVILSQFYVSSSAAADGLIYRCAMSFTVPIVKVLLSI